MCATCGCGGHDARIEGKDGHRHHHHGDHDHHHDHGHDHDHDHHHDHAHDDEAARIIAVEADILAKNDAYAAGNRAKFDEKGILALNLVSSPGSGKTSLLVRTITDLNDELAIAVVEGDQQTDNDANRIKATGAPAVQVNTGKGCHLDGHMVGHALEHLDPGAESVVMIENVGNLVCPAAFDLGEAHKVVILSVTEGDDKPLKYPDMFAASDLMVLSKTDLLPYLDFDVEACLANAKRINPRIRMIEVSAKSGEGLAAWYDWIRAARQFQLAGRTSRQAAQ